MPVSDSNRPRAQTGSDSAQSCPRCNGTSFGKLFDGPDRLLRKAEGVFAVVECSGCGMAVLDRAAVGATDPWHPEPVWWEGEPSIPGQVARLVRRLGAGREIRFVKTSRHVNRPLLDLSGADWFENSVLGPGVIVWTVAPEESPATESDVAERRALRVRLPDAFLAKGTFAVISAIHVLEHEPDPVETLLRVRDFLADGGSLVLKLPNADSWQALLLGSRWNGCDLPRHSAMYRREDIQALLETCGYKLIRYRQFSLRDDPTGLAASLCPWLDPAIRRHRNARESRYGRFFKNVLYGLLVLLVLPFTLLEWAGGSAASLMVEATPSGRESRPGPQRKKAARSSRRPRTAPSRTVGAGAGK